MNVAIGSAAAAGSTSNSSNLVIQSYTSSQLELDNNEVAHQTRATSSNICSYDKNTLELINHQNKISDDLSLQGLIHDNNFNVDDHLINIINIEVVIKSLQLKNVDYIQNVVVTYLSKIFDIEKANQIGLVNHLDMLASTLFQKLDEAIISYSKMLASNKSKTNSNFGIKISNFEDSKLQGAYKVFEDSIHDNIVAIKEDVDQENSAIPLAFNKFDLKRRIYTVIVQVIKFLSEAYQHFISLQPATDVNSLNSGSSFIAFVTQYSSVYLSNSKIAANINKSAMNAFYNKIFTDELVINAKTIYDCVQIHKLAIIKNKKRNPVTSNEIKRIFQSNIGPISQNKIDNLVTEFNEIKSYRVIGDKPNKQALIPELQKPKEKRKTPSSDDDFLDSEDEYEDIFGAPKRKKIKHSDGK